MSHPFFPTYMSNSQKQPTLPQEPPRDDAPLQNVLAKLAHFSYQEIDFSPLQTSLQTNTLQQLQQSTMDFFLGKTQISEYKTYVHSLEGNQEAIGKLIRSVMKQKEVILSVIEVSQREAEKLFAQEKQQQGPQKTNREVRKIRKITPISDSLLLPSSEAKRKEEAQAVKEKELAVKEKEGLFSRVGDEPEPLDEPARKRRLLASRIQMFVDQASSEGETSGVVVDLVSEKSEKDLAKEDGCDEAIQKASQLPVKEDNDKKQSSLVSSDSPRKKVKCKFYPKCNRKDCKYFHPTEKCTFFPRCKYGANCLNLHPDCKFGEHCTRRDCYYSHPKKVFKSKPKAPAIPTALSSIMQNITMEKLQSKRKESEQSKTQ